METEGLTLVSGSGFVAFEQPGPVVLPPNAQRPDDLIQGLAVSRQAVFHTYRNGVLHRTLDEFVFFQIAQFPGQHPGRDAFHGFRQFVETPVSKGKRDQNGQLPFAANEFNNIPYRADVFFTFIFIVHIKI
jgi:hypothetical protein